MAQYSMTTHNQRKAIERCARWLTYCLSIGWPREDLDELEAIWWRYHDDEGKLRACDR
jgi:hypothetical protein